MRLALHLALPFLIHCHGALGGFEPLGGHKKVYGTTIPARPAPAPTGVPEINRCISVAENTPANLKPNLDNNDGWNPFRGVKFADCKKSIPENKLLDNGKCQRARDQEAKFCPTTRFWFYGQPMPHDGTYCTQTQECSVSQQITHEFNEAVSNGKSVMKGTQETHQFGIDLGFDLGMSDKESGMSGTAKVGFSASVANAFMKQYTKTVSETKGWSDSSTTVTTINRPKDSMDVCGRYYALPIYQG
ncbi:hypothetical protein PG985_004512 [Apiospora marii]|uniref:Uncharacterized protein n=1 Tax=Apiospora marii TaxID=335849 RepID=A0ABR1S9I6_9PEZI